jgi:hypothetical protein
VTRPEASQPAWRVDRVAGVLPPGFTKRFAGTGEAALPTVGTTYFLGVPIGRFDVVATEADAVELRYRRWPVVDVLDAAPTPGRADLTAAGYLRLLKGSRTRFCRFRLTS